jgi:hypothetical protein
MVSTSGIYNRDAFVFIANDSGQVSDNQYFVIGVGDDDQDIGFEMVIGWGSLRGLRKLCQRRPHQEIGQE